MVTVCSQECRSPCLEALTTGSTLPCDHFPHAYKFMILLEASNVLSLRAYYGSSERWPELRQNPYIRFTEVAHQLIIPTVDPSGVAIVLRYPSMAGLLHTPMIAVGA